MRNQNITFPAPRRGWMKNANLSQSPIDAAEILDNIFPTAQGARLRKGSNKHATVAAEPRSLFAFNGGTTVEMFAATDDAIYDITNPSSPDVSPTASVTGLAGGDWSSRLFTTSGGSFLTIANGLDNVRQYNGTTWSTPTITGPSSKDLSYVWAFKNRLWFVEKNSNSAWYLGTNAVSGAATEFPLRGIFNLGGNLLFGASWSIDAGDGIDDLMVFVSDLGEVAVYSGTDPSSNFALSGVYFIGRPVSKHAHFRAGGDLAIATDEGIVSVSEALRKERGALQASALTYPIEEAWQEAIANRTSNNPISVTLHSKLTQLVIGTPNIVGDSNVAFVANTRTGAWCRYTGWDVRCSIVFNDRFFFGTSASTIVEGEVGGNDQGSEFAGLWVPKFQEGDASMKVSKLARFRGRTNDTYNIGLACFSDYEIGAVSSPVVTGTSNQNLWDVGLWGVMRWGGDEYRAYLSEWQSVTGFGAALSPAVILPVNRPVAPNLEVIAMDVVYEQGNII